MCEGLYGTAGTTLEIEKLTMPTLFIAGEEDKVSTVEWARKTEARMPDANIEVLKGWDIGVIMRIWRVSLRLWKLFFEGASVCLGCADVFLVGFS